ncbi:nucleotide sugar dehydrogenase [Thermodesulfobium narugense DSM 14796]|uniref:Nucleotide sugar dehydrogenase n=1 Tax=Thermodesulfobium narugense DSM 14796 TaxID=747365 RepID=M1E7L3_9BACT|nr:nucleotide sugar dehydrogenase [Thermodesulfobium narugense]AEE14044.1 nucleotide sugar dehydrogenase [Thermodesulfobium narugense DSM 14796]AEE14471.1 nucleotide sugar dehydrogenase [Thermodesulfobium narugense DSM 14796]
MSFKYDVCIVGGLGHVGLPLGLSFANKNLKTILYDINKDAIELVKNKVMPFMEQGAEEMLKNTLDKTLFVTDERDVIKDSKFIVIVIGTPVDEHLSPNFVLFRDFLSRFINLFSDDQHIILRSTVYPGTTEKIVDYLRRNNLKTRVSFCPERIAQGYAIAEISNLPQIISSDDEESFSEAEKLFKTITSEVIRLSFMEAELAKLFTNVYRYIKFSIANQFYQIALQNNLDFYKIYDAIVYNYPRAKDFPKAGFTAGPCLFKDTMQLAAFSKNNFFLGHAAMLVNEGLPYFLVEQLKQRVSLDNKVVGILGMAFKPDCDDKRESLAYKLKHILEFENCTLFCSDPYIKDPRFLPEDELIEKCDIIFIGCPHSRYSSLNIPSEKILIDPWRSKQK